MPDWFTFACPYVSLAKDWVQFRYLHSLQNNQVCHKFLISKPEVLITEILSNSNSKAAYETGEHQSICTFGTLSHKMAA